MFTSRAEYRILLRQDNADERLTRIGEKLGTINNERINILEEKERLVEEVIVFLSGVSVMPEEINEFLDSKGTSKISQKVKAITLAMRPQIEIKEFLLRLKGSEKLNVVKSKRFSEIGESAEIRIKYEGYILREKIVADKIKRLESLRIPGDILYNELMSISTEGRQRLEKIKPENIGQATRISGVSPSDINILLMYLGR
jgi:tRNA uridine 5-carboxymethylaminomethyl modification enzyme